MPGHSTVVTDVLQTRPLSAESVTQCYNNVPVIINGPSPAQTWAQVKTDFQFHLIGPIEGQVLSRPGPRSEMGDGVNWS